MDDLPVAEILRIARSHGAVGVRVFGSRARGDNRPDSDLDLLVYAGPRFSLWDLIGVKQDLEDLLGVPVDVATEAALHPMHREQILREAIVLGAA